MSRARPYEAKELPITIVQPGVQLLDTAWAQINTLGGLYFPSAKDDAEGNARAVFFSGHYTAVNQALSIIESLGGKDPLKRKHNRGES